MTHRSLIALLLLVHASAGCYVPLEDGLPEGEPGDRFRSFQGLGI